LKSAQEKAKAETRNQVDQVKNEVAKMKAEMERERKKLAGDNQSLLEL